MNFKAFVSENQLEESRRTRQAEWEKVRKPDDPEEAPEEAEEPYDPRSLFDRLQEQKILKQEEFDESRRLKNLICVLDQDETSFLEQVDRNKMEDEFAKIQEERIALEEFRQAIKELTQDEQEYKINEFKKTFSLKGSNRKSTKRLLNGSLANIIKKAPPKESKQISDSSPSFSDLKPSMAIEGSDRKPNDRVETNHLQNQSKVALSNAKSPVKSITEEPKTKQVTLKTCLVDYGSDSDSDSDDESIHEENPPTESVNKRQKLT